MSKKAHPRRLAETEVKSVLRNIRVSPRKLGLVVGLIRGRKADDALAELTFSRRRIAKEVKKALQSAIANAENNHQLDVDRLIVKEASVGKSFIMKRFHARGRGRAARVTKSFSHLTIVVGERQDKAAKPAADEAKETA
ncbi:MAG: 50S ribosomal protein L22 [Alphaproteobacteria bacterium]|nr:50S ribosomal protein L22 [Alphaproteobacteria bacterium]